MENWKNTEVVPIKRQLNETVIKASVENVGTAAMMSRKNNPKNKDVTHTRVNYEDHSLKFLDWVDRLGLERTIFGKIAGRIEEKLQTRRFAFVFIFTLILAYAITFEVRTPLNFQIGEIVKFDVISPVSFEMVDEVTTEEKRVRAELAVPIILDFDPAVFERVSSAVYRAFRILRLETKNIVWPRSFGAREEKIKDFVIHKGEFEKALGVTVPDYLFEWLVRNRFNARLENVVIRNLDIWYLNRIGENIERLIPPNQSMVLARTINKNNHGREFNLRRNEILDASNPDNFVLKNLNGLERASEKDILNLQEFSRRLVYSNLTLNKQEMASRRQAARDSVLPITVSVKKNQVLLSEGTVIQPFHMAMIKEIQTLRSDRRHDILAVAISFIFLSIIVVFFQYLRRFSQNRVKVDNKDIFVMGVVTLITVVVAKLSLFFFETALVSRFGSVLPHEMFLYLMPVAAAPMIVGLLIQSGEVVWLFTAFLSVAMGLMTEMNFSFMVVTFAGGIAAARGVYNCKKRNDIYWAGVRTGTVSALMIALMFTVTKMDQDNFLKEILSAVPAGFLSGILSSMVAMFFVPFLESVFSYTTDVKLLELSNLNHPLLKDMIVKAPGTYHHSMLVGSMVEAAAEEIAANPLLAKVMSYYHDIGKMEHANYFIENQKPSQNPHDHISPYMSKTLLVAHVKDGVELGMAYKLGKPIIDGIIQHHGTTLISYFYNKAVDLKTESESDISEEEFRYPGPKPQFREAALCMLADSIEAASRSLDEPTPVRLQNIVRNIVQRKFMEGQLDECSMTLKDLSRVELAFTRILLGIYHQRIDYPRSAGGGASETPGAYFPSQPK
jgi:putative nucleotidyltransferase with HDIG domain